MKTKARIVTVGMIRRANEKMMINRRLGRGADSAVDFLGDPLEVLVEVDSDIIKDAWKVNRERRKRT